MNTFNEIFGKWLKNRISYHLKLEKKYIGFFSLFVGAAVESTVIFVRYRTVPVRNSTGKK